MFVAETATEYSPAAACDVGEDAPFAAGTPTPFTPALSPTPTTDEADDEDPDDPPLPEEDDSPAPAETDTRASERSFASSMTSFLFAVADEAVASDCEVAGEPTPLASEDAR